MEFSVYCDESCHLENDGINVMLLGAIWCPTDKREEIFQRIRQIKTKHGLSPTFEIKWSKVSSGNVEFYLDLIDYYFDDDHLSYRCLIVPDKSKLDHAAFQQTHDDFYYKMYFDLIKVLVDPDHTYSIYLDIKDTRSSQKADKLRSVLSYNRYDFSRKIVRRVQNVRSHEIELIQVCDLITGAIGYNFRGLVSSPGKLSVIEAVKQRSGYSLVSTTLIREKKMNLFRWDPARTHHG
ncbi:MAG: DUF3800 domain-containing protein [Bacteroidota bacterium]